MDLLDFDGEELYFEQPPSRQVEELLAQSVYEQFLVVRAFLQ